MPTSTEHLRNGRKARTDPATLPRYRLPNSRRVMVRTSEWKMSYFINRDGDARDGDLYHLTEDPGEKHNLWADKTYAEVVAQLESRIKQWDQTTKS